VPLTISHLKQGFFFIYVENCPKNDLLLTSVYIIPARIEYLNIIALPYIYKYGVRQGINQA